MRAMPARARAVSACVSPSAPANCTGRRVRMRRALAGTLPRASRTSALAYHALPAKRENESDSSDGAELRALAASAVCGDEIAEPEHGAFGQRERAGRAATVLRFCHSASTLDSASRAAAWSSARGELHSARVNA